MDTILNTIKQARKVNTQHLTLVAKSLVKLTGSKTKAKLVAVALITGGAAIDMTLLNKFVKNNLLRTILGAYAGYSYSQMAVKFSACIDAVEE